MARDLELEGRIREDPGNEELRLVYADFLQDQGDPRGEIIALQQRASQLVPGTDEHDEIVQQIEAIEAEYEDEIFGPAARYRRNISIRWEWGMIRTLSLRLPEDDYDIEEAVSAVIEAPAAACLQRFLLAHDGGQSLQPAVDVIADAEFGVNELHLGAQFRNVKLGLNLIRDPPRRRSRWRELFTGPETRPAIQQIVDDLRGLKRVQELQVVGFAIDTGGELASDELRRLALREDVQESCFTDLSNSSLPELEELTLSAKHADTVCILSLLNAEFPKLHTLKLRHIHEPEHVLPELPQIETIRRLKSILLTVSSQPALDLIEQIRTELGGPELRVRWERF